MAAKFVHLHVHSHYSLLAALPKLPDLIDEAKRQGHEAIALTDLGNLYGAIEFIKECHKANIKPIIGVDVELESRARLVLLAENNAGYENLLAIVTDSYFAADDSKPVVILDTLRKHHDGVIALAKSSIQDIASLKEIFGEKNLYVDVAMREIYYVQPEDRRAWETMRKIAHNDNEENNAYLEEEDFHFPSVAEMEEQFSEAQLAQTIEIAERCNVDITIGKFIFPEFPLPAGKTGDDVLRELCETGLRARGLENDQAVLDRLNYELGIIKFKGYSTYFLVVEDLIRFARENNIYTNIRGSVAGSMTTYLLQITKIDPLAYKIPFERFLNPERPSAPDIDMDFADDRRDEVIEYARQKYGEAHVAQIGTFGTMLARGVVRDVARALGYPYGLGDRIAKEIPMGSQGFPMTLERALNENPELAKMYKADAEAREIIDLGKKLEGCARHVGVHAAGVVIAPRPLVEYTPLQKDPKGGKTITQYDMYSVGEDGVGLTKFDFLGITNLTMLASAVELIETTRDKKIDIETIPLDDAKTFEMLTRGETEAVFQLNGGGMTKALKELRPTSIHDINAMVALYRPGPMQFIPQYIERKHNPSRIKYFDPAMEPILKQTYGILVYQDDLLIMANQLAGYSWGEVDKFRKAVGKKIPEEMAKQKEKFIEGCISTSGWPRAKAERVWEWIEPFAAYGFNKAHSASYGRVAYQTAYLKANYGVEYLSAALTADAGDVDKVAVLVQECKRMGIDVLPPDINHSFGDFTAILGSNNKERSRKAASLAGDAQDDAIRFGLYSIKNFGEGVADEIIKERKENGPFTTLSDFLTRTAGASLNKKSLESLIQCGALDSLGERGQMLANLELMLQFQKDAGAEQSQDSLFAGLGNASGEIQLAPAAPAPQHERLAWEKELLGLYVSGHPLDQHKEKLSKRPMTIGQMKQKIMPGMTAVAAGMIQDMRVILTKGGDQMAFIKIADYDGTIEAVVFPKNFTEHKDILKPDTCIALKGRLSNRNGELSMVAEALKAL
ncbi:MAG TPA: DNA polymerase III subunit alpha [Candidatus Paceibacterota bacterium]|nr:DNA polymerase III subunit alpha [Candidatus Paceibacterota bacterium]